MNADWVRILSAGRGEADDVAFVSGFKLLEGEIRVLRIFREVFDPCAFFKPESRAISERDCAVFRYF